VYDVLKNHLTHGAYGLEDAKKRIYCLVAAGQIDPSQVDELIALAEANASAPRNVEQELSELRQGLEVTRRAVVLTAKLGLTATKREQVEAVFACGDAGGQATESD